MPELTFVIPVATYHKDLAARAIASVRAQSLPCELVVIEDTAGHGAGWARNQGLQQVTTPFVSFLDADDTLSPKFAEMCLLMWKPERYVYTDWYVAGYHYKAPSPCNLWTTRHYKERPADIPDHELQQVNGEWIHKTYHLITTVLPVAIVRQIGGFDEQLPAVEDTDFGIRLRLAGVCGIHVKEALLTYNGDGQRSLALQRNPAVDAITSTYLKERYGSQVFMGCCGGNEGIPVTPGNDRQDGDILVMPTWTGNKPIYGAASGRFYGARIGGQKPLWIDPADYIAMQGMFVKAEARQPGGGVVVLQPRYLTNGAPQQLQQQPDATTWRTAGDAAFGGGQPAVSQPAAPQNWNYQPVENSRSIRDTLKIGQKKTE